MDIQSLPYLSLLNPSSCLYFGQVTQSPWYHLGLNSCLVPLFMVNIVELMQHPSKSIVPLSFSTIKTGKLKMHPPQTFFIDYVTHFLPMRSISSVLHPYSSLLKIQSFLESAWCLRSMSRALWLAAPPRTTQGGGGGEDQLPDLENKNSRHPARFEFQINNV